MQLASAGMDVTDDTASNSFVVRVRLTIVLRWGLTSWCWQFGTLLGAVGMLIPIPKARQELFVEVRTLIQGF